MPVMRTGQSGDTLPDLWLFAPCEFTAVLKASAVILYYFKLYYFMR